MHYIIKKNEAYKTFGDLSPGDWFTHEFKLFLKLFDSHDSLDDAWCFDDIKHHCFDGDIEVTQVWPIGTFEFTEQSP